MLNRMKNTSGFTLVEILASVVLLTVVISLFLSIFPQMASVNNKNGDNLDAANAGKELLVLVKKNTYTDFKSRLYPATSPELEIESNKFTINKIEETEKILNAKSHKYIQITGTFESFDVEILVSNNGVFEDKIIDGKVEKATFQLHQVTIIVKNNNSAPLTTTYGYIEEN